MWIGVRAAVLVLLPLSAVATITELVPCLAIPCNERTDRVLAPGGITAGVGDFTLIIRGSELEEAEGILWNNAPVASVHFSDTEKRITVRRAMVATPGPALVTLTGSNSLPFVIHPPPAILTQSLPAGRAGTPYSLQLAACCGTPPLRWTAVAAAGLAVTPNGVLAGIPPQAGQFTIRIQVEDAARVIDNRPFSLTIVGDVPVAADDSYTTLVDQRLIIQAPGVLRNDTDPDAGPLRAVIELGPAAGGTFSMAEDGSFEYTPPAGFTGRATFRYRAVSGRTLFRSAPATVTIHVLRGEPACRLVPEKATLYFAPTFSFVTRGFDLKVAVEVSVNNQPAPGVPIQYRARDPVPGIPESCRDAVCSSAITDGNGSFEFAVARSFTAYNLPSVETYAEGTLGGQTFFCVGHVSASIDENLLCGSQGLGKCIAAILGKCEDVRPESSLAPLRQFRDRILARTESGRRYIDQYYRLSPEMVRIALRNPRLFLRGRQALQRHLPLVQAVLDGRPASLSHKDLDEIVALIRAFEDQGSPELRRALSSLRERLNQPGFLAGFGVKIEDTRAPVTTSVAMGALPLRFERASGGVTNEYLLRGIRYGLRLKPAQAILAKAGGGGAAWRLDGSNPLARAAPLNELPGRTNYISGRDPSKWRTGVRQYAKVRYQGIYPGVDLVYYGNQGQLEFDFIVAPGSKPSQIRLSFPGDKRAVIDRNGDLHIDEGLRLRKPVAYQMAGGVRRPVEAAYRMSPGNRAGFALGAYDPNVPLVIDPILSYSSYIGGSQDDFGAAVAVDTSGSAYYVGATVSPDFALRGPLQGAIQRGGEAGADVFVTKLNPAGNAVVYSTYFGGSDDDIGLGIAVDAQGNAYITGATRSRDLPLVQPLQHAFGGAGPVTGTDAFAAKLNPAGSALIYSTYVGGAGDDGARGIAVDAAGSVYIAGATSSNNFPLANALQAANRGGPGVRSDAFVSKINAAGTALVYSTYLGGSNDDAVTSLAIDAAGSAYVTGATFSSDFPLAAPLQRTSGGSAEVFVSKLNPSGSALAYSTYLGGRDEDYGMGIAVDQQGNAYVTGSTGSRVDFPQVNAAQAAFGSRNIPGVDAFVTKLNPAGSALTYSTFLGGSRYEMGLAIAVDASGNAYVAGETGSADFASTGALQPAEGGGGKDGFVAKLLASGSAFEYRSFHGGSNPDSVMGIAVDGAGSVFLAGGSLSLDSPATFGALQPISRGGLEALAAKITAGTPPPAFTSVSAASLRTDTALAPESIATGFGQRLAAGTAVASGGTLPSTLAGASVNITDSAGVTLPAPLFAVTPGQINYLVPAGLRSGLASVQVMDGTRVAASGTARIQSVAPSLFTANSTGRGVASALVVRVASGGERTTQPVFQCGAGAGSCTSTPIPLAPETDEIYLLLFGTGIRGFTSPVTATAGGVSVPVLAAVPQGETPGLDQVNLGPLPRELAGRGEVDVVLTVDGRRTRPVRVNFR